MWDSRRRPTVETEVTLQGGARGRAIAPAVASTGREEAIDLRDGATHIVMWALHELQRLAALVPRRHLHLIRFHGVLAPNASSSFNKLLAVWRRTQGFKM